MRYIEEFNYGNINNNHFTDKVFKDTSLLKQYLRQSDSQKKRNYYFEQVISIVDNFFELRTKAEVVNKKSNFFRIYNKEKDLPLSWEDINSVLIPKNDDILSEPPIRLINIIAKEKFGTIQKLSCDMRKLLQRKREMVPMDKVQELDSTCIRWLTKQPGYTTEQKAGNKQRVMSIVRLETLDTLENRVFKDFLRLCVSECRRYIDKFEKHFNNSQRIKEVRKLQNLAILTLSKPEMQTIKKLYNYPKPNYVLQNNSSYKTIWDLYKKLLHKSKLLESAWINRQVVVSQFNQLCLFNYFINLPKEFNSKQYYFTSPTVNLMPSKNGIFINNLESSIKLIYLKKNQVFIQISPTSSLGTMQISIQKQNNIPENYFIHFLYIPLLKNLSSEFSFNKYTDYSSHYFIVYKESPEIIFNVDNKINNSHLIEINNNNDPYEIIQINMSKILFQLGAFNE